MKKLLSLCMLIFLFSGCASPKDSETSKQDTTNLNQTDYVRLLSNYNSTNESLKAQFIGDRNLWIYQPIAHEKYVGHYFEKNKNDDFILYSSSVIGSLQHDNFIPEQYIMAGSNKEFAFRAKPRDSSGNFYWFPEHENVGTVFANQQSILFDGIEQNMNVPGNIIDVKSVEIKQKLEFKYPDTNQTIANLLIQTDINKNGVTYNAEGQWLTDIAIEKGYVAMLPTISPPMSQLHTSIGDNYELKKVDDETSISNSEKVMSYAYSSKPLENQPYVMFLAQTINNLNDTLRIKQPGKKEPEVVWLEHRNNGSVQKIYPQIYDDHFAAKGDEFGFSSSLYTGLFSP